MKQQDAQDGVDSQFKDLEIVGEDDGVHDVDAL